MDNWYIKIHRKILEWEWYDDINTKILFLHILLKANWEDKKWHWIEIKRWELLTWRKILALETQLTEQQVRTSLNKLKSTNEITIKTTKQYSIIKAINYDNYQQQITNNSTNEQPTSNQRVTTTKELKELKELKEDNNIIEPKGSEQSSTEIVIKEDKRDLDIDLIIESIKNCNEWIIDDQPKNQRRYWKLIKEKINKIKWFEKFNNEYNTFIQFLYDNSDQYRKNHFRSLEKFYREMANIIAWIKINHWEMKKKGKITII